MTLSARYIDAALAELPKAAPGTQDARDLMAIRKYVENAKARLVLLEKRRGQTEFLRSPETGRIIA